MGLARECYKKVAIGATGTLAASSSVVSDLEQFEAIVAEFEALEHNGLIVNTELHKESHTGHRYVDLVRFRKIK